MAPSHSSIVWITGAGSGIGLAAAKRFWAEGWRVVLIGRDQLKLSAAAREAPSEAALVLACDVADAKAVERVASAFLKNEPPFRDWLQGEPARADALVNNAGVYERGSCLEADDASWERQFQINLLGSVRMTKALLPHFFERKAGSIVNVASTLGLRPAAETAAYSASKAAMISWTKTLALECAPFGVRANCVAPGLVETPIHPAIFGRTDAEARALRAKYDQMQPMGRIGAPEEVAEAIFYFCRPLSAWTTGAVLPVDGGIGLA